MKFITSTTRPISTSHLLAILSASLTRTNAQTRDPNPGPDVNLVPFIESINTVTENFRKSDCAVDELALGNELCPLPNNGDYTGEVPRKLLRFTTGVWNQGSNDLVVDRTDPESDANFIWGDCHKHWHFNNFTLYELINEETQEIVTGRKQAFCLMDIRRMDSGAPSKLYDCGNQGISAGWADIYSYALDGQWIDITGVPAGKYTLRVTINYGQTITETRYDDNVAIKYSTDDADLTIAGSECNDGGGGGGGGPVDACFPTDSDCSSNEDCCTAICTHQLSQEAIKMEEKDTRFLRDVTKAGTGERELQMVATGKCTCQCKKEPCTADHECCSGNCKHNECKGGC